MLVLLDDRAHDHVMENDADVRTSGFVNENEISYNGGIRYASESCYAKNANKSAGDDECRWTFLVILILRAICCVNVICVCRFSNEIFGNWA